MGYSTIQKTKKWFKNKKLNFKVVFYNEPTIIPDEDFTNISWTEYGGYNHKNRNRKGGHVSNWRCYDYPKWKIKINN